MDKKNNVLNNFKNNIDFKKDILYDEDSYKNY